MADEPAINDDTPTEPLGHIIGFMETRAACDDVVIALHDIGVPDERVLVFYGEDGLERFHKMMDGSQWGEEAERVMKDGDQQLTDGKFVICIEEAERPQALRIAAAAKIHGGHGFSHFRTMVDERITR